MPTPTAEVNRIRTGYETVIAHRTTSEFANVAQRSGTILAVDHDLGIVHVQYDPTPPKIDHVIQAKHPKVATLHQTHTKAMVLVPDTHDYTTGQILKINPGGYLFTIKKIQSYTDHDRVPKGEILRDYTTPSTSPVYSLEVRPHHHDPRSDQDLFPLGDQYTNVAGSYVKQPLVTKFQPGDTFHKEDVITYNEGFFEPDPHTQQVHWKHGVMATIAVMDLSDTFEDASIITTELGRRLTTGSAHERMIEITNNTKIHDIVSIGQHVNVTDILCSFEDHDISELVKNDDPETYQFLQSLNRKTPKAKYHGVVSDVQVYYTGEFDDLHPTIQALIKKTSISHRKRAALAKGTKKSDRYIQPGPVPPGLRYKGVEFMDSVVAISVMITHDIVAGVGDKIVIGGSNKTVIGRVLDEGPTPSLMTESGVLIDCQFSAQSIANRVVTSPYLIGVGNRVIDALERSILDIYDT